MGKIEGSWSGMRKYLEKEMLAECLKGRVRYNCTRYVGMDGCHLFELYIDDALLKRFSLETVNSYFMSQGCSKDKRYWDGFWNLLASTKLQDRTEYTDEEFCEALKIYRQQCITDSIDSENPLVMMFAILDRRIGKRKLTIIKDSFGGRPEWLLTILNVRLGAEKQMNNVSES